MMLGEQQYLVDFCRSCGSGQIHLRPFSAVETIPETRHSFKLRGPSVQ